MGCLNSKSSAASSRPSLSLTYETENPITSTLLGAAQNSSSSSGASLYSSTAGTGISLPQAPTALLTETDAIILAANYCKDKSPFTWCDEALPCIGSRQHKWHYYVKGEDSEEQRGKKRKQVSMVMVLTHLLRGHEQAFPIPLSSGAILEVFASLCCGIDNPYVFPCEDVDYIRDRHTLVVTRKWTDSGSLRDLVYRQSPKTPFVQKNKRANGKPLPLAQVQAFGRHVLEALNVLNAKGIVVDCLTSANVLVEHRVARLADLENTLLGAGAKPVVVEMLMQVSARAIEDGATPCAFDVQLFGLVLLEICTGAPMIPGSFLQEIEDHFCDRSFPSCSTPEDTKAVGSLRHLLIDIFSKHDASVKSLLTSHVFSSVPLPLASPRLKLSSAEKGLVKSAMKASQDAREAVLTRIQAERAAEDEERQRRMRDVEETAMAVSTADPRGEANHSRRVSVLKRQSQGTRKQSGTSSTPTSPTPVHNADSSGQSTEGHHHHHHHHHSEPLESDNHSAVSGPGSHISHSSSTSSQNSYTHHHTEGSSANVTVSMPDKYKKMLSIGLAHDQVLHKMVQDGFDPATVGW